MVKLDQLGEFVVYMRCPIVYQWSLS